jgi:hypothetical protein
MQFCDAEFAFSDFCAKGFRLVLTETVSGLCVRARTTKQYGVHAVRLLTSVRIVKCLPDLHDTSHETR